MKTPAIVGALLIILGVIAFAYQGFTYTTTEKAIDLGPIQVTAEKQHTFPLPPVVGAIAIVGGIFLLATSGRKA
jgi:membrane-bound ClpP family serine protease